MRDELIALLTPITQDTGFFGRSTLARTAAKVRKSIVERTGAEHLSGGLTVQDGHPIGALSVSDSKLGPLSVKSDASFESRATNWKTVLTMTVLTAMGLSLLI